MRRGRGRIKTLRLREDLNRSHGRPYAVVRLYVSWLSNPPVDDGRRAAGGERPARPDRPPTGRCSLPSQSCSRARSAVPTGRPAVFRQAMAGRTHLTGWDWKGPGSQPAPTTQAARDLRSLGPLARRSRARRPQDGVRGPWFERRLAEPSFVIPEIADFRRQRVAAADSGYCKSLLDRPVRSYR